MFSKIFCYNYFFKWLQKQVTNKLGIGCTNYNNMENGKHEPSAVKMQKMSKLFRMTVDQILNGDADIPNDVTLEDKSGIG